VTLGEPSSYLALGRRTPVYGSGGEFIGVVKKVECDRSNDIFDGLVISTSHGDRYLPAELVLSVHEHGVEVAISEERALELPRPDAHASPDGDHALWAELLEWLVEHLGLHHEMDPRIDAAGARIERRHRALELARHNPELALEAGVGRPDVVGAFHRGVVDVNNATVEALTGLPGVDRALAERIVAVREECGGFSSLDELGMELDLPGDVVEALRGLVVFLPRSAP
jgi:hypothetical protein